MEWLSTPTKECPRELNNAYSTSRVRVFMDRYRSRSDVTADHIITAFSWMRLSTIKSIDEPLVAPDRNYIRYITRSVKRGIPAEEAVTAAAEVIAREIGTQKTCIITFNTGTAATGADAIKNRLDTDEDYTELNVRTMLVSTPTHKINVYKKVLDGRTIYVILNNVNSPSVLFKLSAALMLDSDLLREWKQTLANKWMTGNADEIYGAVEEYYREYNANLQSRVFKEALELMIKNANNAKNRQFTDKIRDLERRIDDYYESWKEAIHQLNTVKGAYMYNTLMDEDTSITNLKTFIETCKNKIPYIRAADDQLTLTYTTELLYFESSLVDPYFTSTRSNVITNAPSYIQQLIKDLFKDVKYRMLIESSILIEFIPKRFRYTPVENVRTIAELKGIPNPHHKYYNCWGDNAPNINRALENYDYVTALTTAFAAMSGINLSDTAVLSKFIIEELYAYKTVPCLKNLETGEIITIQEYERRFNNASNETN